MYPGYAQPVYGPGATGHPSLSTTLQAALSAIPADRYRSALAMLRLRRPARRGSAACFAPVKMIG